MIKKLLVLCIVIFVICGCVPRKQEPMYPIFGGTIYGVPDDILVTKNILEVDTNWRVNHSEQFGSGPWQTVVTAKCFPCVVTAEADGYISHPTSYTVNVVDGIAYIFNDGHLEGMGAVFLNFYFEKVE